MTINCLFELKNTSDFHVRSRTRKNRPTGCPICKIFKGESLIENYLKNKEIKYELQKRFKNCRDIKPLLEFQGIQHFESVDFGGNSIFGLEKIKKRDRIKKKWCLSNNYNLVCVPYWQINNIENILEQEIFND